MLWLIQIIVIVGVVKVYMDLVKITSSVTGVVDKAASAIDGVSDDLKKLIEKLATLPPADQQAELDALADKLDKVSGDLEAFKAKADSDTTVVLG